MAGDDETVYFRNNIHFMFTSSCSPNSNPDMFLFLQNASQPTNADSGSHQRLLAAFPVQHGHLPIDVSPLTVQMSLFVALCYVVSNLFIVCHMQIHLGAADPRPLIPHATGQLQCRPRALAGLHVSDNDPTQQLHHAPVPVSLPLAASGLSALPAAPAATAVLSGTLQQHESACRPEPLTWIFRLKGSLARIAA